MRRPVSKDSTITLGIFLALVTGLVGGGIWMGAISTKMDLALEKLKKLDALEVRVRVLEVTGNREDGSRNRASQ